MTAAVQPINDSTVAKPFLKWAGGKSQLLQILLPLTKGVRFKTYIEPFVGGGALFFALGHRPSVIADANEELVLTYRMIRDNCDEVIATLKTFINSEEFFYSVRSWEPGVLSNPVRAARLIFLNKTCFNGLYRVNKAGKFNTPYNGNEGASFINEEVLRNASIALKGVSILPGSYETILAENAKSGDLIFLDPPYRPVGKYADFKRYTKERFHDNDQEELSIEFKRLVDLGCKVILTNSAHDSILELYKDYDLQIVNAKRLISSNVSSRKGSDLIVLGGF